MRLQLRNTEEADWKARKTHLEKARVPSSCWGRAEQVKGGFLMILGISSFLKTNVLSSFSFSPLNLLKMES